ncbi:electrogenic sodium bicarbonate cotransporter 4-like [Mytilus edulis]|uniref:electrogenic sodium bicarbonate cotransporter 4-like n=1 Tax=Mytilus edulis TaxID=6550 RepID=UPI0039EFC176
MSAGTSASDSGSHEERIRTISRFVLDLITQNDETTPTVFCQFDALTKSNEEVIWKEYARWVKHDEDVKENVKRWSKPHNASVTSHCLLELKTQMSSGAITLEADVRSLAELTGK